MKMVWHTILLAFLALSGVAQESAAPRVTIPLIASGSHHRPASVTLESLGITDQKTPVTGASLVRGTDLPVELGVLIDASASQRSVNLDIDIPKAAKRFADETIHGQDGRVFFLKFDATPQATGWLRKEQLQDTVFKVGSSGGTALYDALVMACTQRLGPRDWHKPTRRILVLISDGEDNQSHSTREDAAFEALKTGTVIFAINTNPIGRSYGLRVMEAFAKLTGGESFAGVGGEDMPKVFARIQELIDGMSYLSYVPPDASKSAVHDVVVKPAPKEKLQLFYPRKYLWNP
jgi:Ca-activated chloride channel homolog